MPRPSPESAPPTDPDPPGASGVSSALFAKLLVLVIALIGTGASLLAIRHQRLETMHRIAETREAIDREVARQRTLDARIAELLHPDAIRQRLQVVDIGPWVPRPERGPRHGGTPESRSLTAPVTEEPPIPTTPRFGPQWALDRGERAAERP